jgi:hypothetical protein
MLALIGGPAGEKMLDMVLPLLIEMTEKRGGDAKRFWSCLFFVVSFPHHAD